MASQSQLRDAERAMLRLLEENGMQMPDRVEYGDTCVWLFWTPQKLVVAVDVDNVSEYGAAGGGSSA
jgi:hypothetical protein